VFLLRSAALYQAVIFMRLTSNEKVIDIMQNTLNRVDTRLVNHGKRVAYLMFKILEPARVFGGTELRDICLLSMLHDIGAYKTEEIDKLVTFETADVWEHSIYGCLFLSCFSPLSELAPIVQYHHAKCYEITQLKNPAHQMLAQFISLCDRADIFVQHNGGADDFQKYANKNRDIKYRDDIVDMFLASGVNIGNIFDNLDSDADFSHLLYDTPMSDEDADKYIKMIVCSIDFRSSQTLIHTIVTARIAELLGRMSGADESQITNIRTGAMLHDLGKIGIPVNILENPGRLNDDEMEIMRTHVDITEKIIDGSVDDVIKNIAIKHHEKLDGSGYPRGLAADEITFCDRVVAIADIFGALFGARSYKEAYPKEKIVKILSDMSAKGLLDPDIVKLSIDRFDEITEAANRESQPIVQAYDTLNEEYARRREEIKNRAKQL
jgi:HD-GYP domain-containing protein (c-di-GMP phosphodiesterase class II)